VEPLHPGLIPSCLKQDDYGDVNPVAEWRYFIPPLSNGGENVVLWIGYLPRGGMLTFYPGVGSALSEGQNTPLKGIWR